MGRPFVINAPREIDVEITSRCNLRCGYCYFFDNPGVDYTDLPTGQWLEFFRECGDAGVMRVRIAGGEPFFRKDLRQLIDGIVSNRMRFSILTNGACISDEIAAYLASTGRCDGVQVSLDGGRAEVHDRVRGRGSFDKAVTGIRTLQRHRVPVHIRCTLHRHNIDHLPELAAFVLEELGIEQLSTNSAGYLGSCRGNAGNLMLDVAGRTRVMQCLEELSHRYPGRLTATAGPLADIRMWRRMEAARAGRLPRQANTGRLTGCGCHAVRLSVRSDGHYAVCDMMANVSLGRIGHDRLLDVWRDNSTLCEFRQRHEIELSSFDECRDCDYADYCTGNCPAISFSMTGEAHRPAPDSCYRLFLRQGGRLPVPSDEALSS